MKVCFLGDQHGNIENFKNIIGILPKEVKYIIQVGDLGLMGNQFEQYLKKINKILISKNVIMYFIDGNHENHHWLIKNSLPFSPKKLLSNIIYMNRGSSLVLNNINILFCGGAVSTDRKHRTLNKDYWKEEIPEKSITDIILSNIDKEYDIFVTHDSPSSFNKLFKSSYFESSSDLFIANDYRERLNNIYLKSKAILNIHGHNHIFNYDEITKNGNVTNIEISLGRDNDYYNNQYLILDFDKLNNYKRNYNNFYYDFIYNKN